MNLNIAVKRIEIAAAKERYQAVITNHGAPVGLTSLTFDTGDTLAASYALDILFTNVVYSISKEYQDKKQNKAVELSSGPQQTVDQTNN